ncbi:MAG: hypothetical protein U1C46_01570 [Bacteroidales bacterium]|nr:hypothetical protein [Bacteroidales bacterium]MDZ4203482.1 hypothetical protein [Bacteroidales bacterium]
MKRTLLLISLFSFCIPFSFSQQQDSLCKVLLREISDSFKGDCKNGLAHGKGTAKGEDTYVGIFKNGLPEGKGKYTYKNGNIFSGYWSNGLKNGKGEFIYFVNGKANIQKGYWENGEYVGTSNPDEFYRVTGLTGIEYYSIKKVEGDEKQIKISFIGAMAKYVPQGLEITISSGQLNQEIKNFFIHHYTCPMNCSVNFTIVTSGVIRQCNLIFDILKPGKYEVLISNS